jgi:hypothetical protein
MDKKQLHSLSPALMARVDACACIAVSDNPEKIDSIMRDYAGRGHDITKEEAGRIYVIGTLKAMKRRGTAYSYADALDMYENEQMGDRGCPLTRTINADKVGRAIATLYKNTNSTPMMINNISVVRMAWSRMDNQRLTASDANPQTWKTVKESPKVSGPSHALNVGKVLGTLYSMWDDRANVGMAIGSLYTELDQKSTVQDSISTVTNNLTLYFNEYTERLSGKVQLRLNELRAYVDARVCRIAQANERAIKADEVIDELMVGKNNKDSTTYKLANFAANLHRNFEHKDSITCTEFVKLLYWYGLHFV